MAGGADTTQPQQRQHLKAPMAKRLWPFKKSPKAACSTQRSRTPSPCPSPLNAPEQLPSPAPSERTLLWLSLTPKQPVSAATKASSPAQSPCHSFEYAATSASGRPELPPKDHGYQASEWREQRQARRMGIMHPPFSQLPVVDQQQQQQLAAHSPALTQHSAGSSTSPTRRSPQYERAESGLERIASLLRWHRPGHQTQEIASERRQQRQQDADSETDQESLVSASEIPVRSFAASRSSLSSGSSRAPPPIYIPRPKVTLTAANGSPRPELSPRPASTEPVHGPHFGPRRQPRLSAPAIISPETSSVNTSNGSSSVYSPETHLPNRSSAANSSLAHAEIGAAHRVSLAPARVISTVLMAGDIGDEIKTAMETPLTGFSAPHTDLVGSPSDEGFPAGPLSAKSAVYLAKSARHIDTPHFDLDVLLQSPTTTEKASKTSCDYDERAEAEAEPCSAIPHGSQDAVRERPSYETVSSVGSATTFQSRSTSATSLASTPSVARHTPVEHLTTFSPIYLEEQSSDIEELANPRPTSPIDLSPPYPSPQPTFQRTKVSELSSEEMNTAMRAYILDSMKSLVMDDPRLLERGSFSALEEELLASGGRIAFLKDHHRDLANKQAQLLAEVARASSSCIHNELVENHTALVHAHYELVTTIQLRELLSSARLEHLAAAATLSLGRLNSSFVCNKDKLAKSDHRLEDMKIQRSSAELRISQLQDRLRAKDAEVRRLKAENRTLQNRSDADGLSLRRPSDAETLHEIQADPSACLSSEFGRVLGNQQGTSPLASPTVHDTMSKPLPRSPSLESLIRDQLPPRTSSTAASTYRFPPVPPTRSQTLAASRPHKPSGLSTAQPRFLGQCLSESRHSLSSSVGHDRIGLKALEDMLDGSYQ